MLEQARIILGIGNCSIAGNSEVSEKIYDREKTVFREILILYFQHQSPFFPSLIHLGKEWGHFIESIPCLNIVF